MLHFFSLALVGTGNDGDEQIQRLPLAHRGRPVLPLREPEVPEAEPGGRWDCLLVAFFFRSWTPESVQTTSLDLRLFWFAGRLPSVHACVFAGRREDGDRVRPSEGHSGCPGV